MTNRSGDLLRPKPPSAFPEPNVPGHGSGLGGYVSMCPYALSQEPQVAYPRPSSPPAFPQPFVPYRNSTEYVNGERYLFPYASAPSHQSLTNGGDSAPRGHPVVLDPPNLPPSQPYEAIKEYAMYTQQSDPGSSRRPLSPPPLFPALPLAQSLADRIGLRGAYSRVPQKKALLIGINYSRHRDHQLRLKWGVHDAHEMARFLQDHHGFHPNNIRMLTDDQRRILPTKTNIVAAMRWLVSGARSSESLFFYFSGHVTQIHDHDRDELDGFIECLCAVDFNERSDPPSGIVVSNAIHDIMVKPLPRGCHLIAVFDCCSSDTLLDLPYMYDSTGMLRSTKPFTVQRDSSEADVISLTICKDNGNGFGTHGGGPLREAFMWYMRRSGNNGTYSQLIQSIRAYMVSNGFTGKPVLSSSHWIDTDKPFIIA